MRHTTMSQLTFNLQPERRSLTVTELTSRIRDLLAKNFTDILVEGEISNCREAQSGHFYFTLKDEKSQVRCVWFKQQLRGVKIRPEDGLKCSLRGSISVYEARGEYQIYVESMEPVGRGALQLAFEQLKKRLEAEGLFDAKHKKPLPVLPSRSCTRRCAHSAAAISECVSCTFSGACTGRRLGPRDRKGDQVFQFAKNGRCTDCRTRRRLNGGSLGVQRRNRCARDF